MSLYRDFVFSCLLSRRRSQLRAAAAFQDDLPTPGAERGPGCCLAPGEAGALPARTPQPPPPPAGAHPAPRQRRTGTEHPTPALGTPAPARLDPSWSCGPGQTRAPAAGWSPGRSGRSGAHPCLVDRVVELRLHRDLAVGVGVHEGQAEAGVVPAPAGQRESHGAAWHDPGAKHGQPWPPKSPPIPAPQGPRSGLPRTVPAWAARAMLSRVPQPGRSPHLVR